MKQIQKAKLLIKNLASFLLFKKKILISNIPFSKISQHQKKPVIISTEKNIQKNLTDVVIFSLAPALFKSLIIKKNVLRNAKIIFNVFLLYFHRKQIKLKRICLSF